MRCARLLLLTFGVVAGGCSAATPGDTAAPPEEEPEEPLPPRPKLDTRPAVPMDAGGAASPAPDASSLGPEDASSADAGVAQSTDGAPAMPPTASDVCNFLLCETFESLADGPFPTNRTWRPVNASRFMVDSTRARSGKRAVRITTPNRPSEDAFLRQNQTFAKTGAKFYGRVFIYFDRIPSRFVHWTFVEGRTSTAYGGKVVRYGGINMNPQLNIETHGSGERGVTDGSMVISTKQWHCVEWFFDGDANQARVWWNGQERTRLHYTGAFGPTFALPKLGAVFVGMALYQNVDVGYDVWMDDLVIHDSKIGCQ